MFRSSFRLVRALRPLRSPVLQRGLFSTKPEGTLPPLPHLEALPQHRENEPGKTSPVDNDHLKALQNSALPKTTKAQKPGDNPDLDVGGYGEGGFHPSYAGLGSFTRNK